MGLLLTIAIVAALLMREKPKPPSLRQVRRSIRREARFATERLRELERDVRKLPPVEPIQEDETRQ
jgi:hypothetical protein